MRPVVRGGFTLTELLMAVAITGTITVGLASFTLAVQDSWEQTSAIDAAAQQGRVALDRIARRVAAAGVYDNGGRTVAGVAVVPAVQGAWRLPETLVVWIEHDALDGAPRIVPDGRPNVSELVLYCPDAEDPGRLVELREYEDTSAIDFEAADFADRVEAVRRSRTATRMLLIDRLRVADLSALGGGEAGACRFEVVATPSDSQIAEAEAGKVAWAELPWMSNLSAENGGLRQLRVRIELQVESEAASRRESAWRSGATPLFGSAALVYLHRSFP